MTARWRGHPHSDLYNMIHAGPGAGASDQQTQYWGQLTDELTQVDTDLNKALGELKASWEGSASQSANEGMSPLQQWAGDARMGSSVMRISTEDQAEYVSTARAEMPKPVQVTTPEPAAWQVAGATAAGLLGNPGPAAAVAVQAVDHEMQEAAQSTAAQKAVDTMNTYESSSTWNRNTLGTFVKPPDVVVSTPMPAGYGVVGGVVVGSLAGGSYSSDRRNIQTSRSGTSGGAGNGTSSPPLPHSANNTGNTGNTGGGNGGHLTPAPLPHGNNTTTDPSNWVPPAPAPPPPTLPPNPVPSPNPPGLNPVGLGGLPVSTTGGQQPGNPGGGKLGGPSGSSGLRGGVPNGLGGGFGADGSHSQPGRGAVVGMGAPGGEGVLGRGTGAGAAGGARGGAMGGAPMGAGAQRDDDDEHFTPDYLLETADVFGDERLVSPAVIGENPPDEEK